jgi:branched-chain amino acid transport system permease protein
MTGLDEGLAIKTTQGITVAVTIILVVVLFWFLNKTRTGKSMRAYSDNEDLALLSGINPKKVVMITWVITGILATVAGALYGLDKSYKPFTYMYLVLPVFASAILGGVGNPVGAIVGGYVIAFSELIFTFAYKKVFMYMLPEHLAPKGLVQLLSTDYKIAVSFVILVIVLLIKPTGIFSGKTI